MSGVGLVFIRIARWYSVLVALIAWELMAHSGLVHRGLMPDLISIGAAVLHGIANGDLAYHSAVTVGRALFGFATGAIAGIMLGALMARSGRFEELFEPIFSFGYPVPKIAFYPLFVFVLGVGTVSKLTLVFLECVYPVAVNTYLGVKAAERIHVWAALSMGASRWHIFWRVLVPTAAPYVFSSLRTAAHVSLIVVIILEMIGDSVGLGYYVAFKSAAFDFADSFAGTAAVIFWGLVFDRLIIWARNRIVFWEPETPRIG